MRPFLKWLGNKYRYINRIKPLLPKGQRLVEPFAGSCALFLNSDYPAFLLADKSPHLFEVYQCLQRDGDAFIAKCRRYFTPRYNHEETFYELRQRFNRTRSMELRAALFLYLNRHGYNGLCRYNLSGEFNVPFGRYDKPYFPENEMHHFHQKSRHAIFIHDDYVSTMKNAKKGDVIYCDPPYVPLSTSSNFSTYTGKSFSLEQQEQLVDLALFNQKRGIPVLISNHDMTITRKLYQKARIYSYDVQRTVSCIGDKRKKVKELLALFS